VTAGKMLGLEQQAVKQIARLLGAKINTEHQPFQPNNLAFPLHP
jgi:hypothetical protein